MDSGSPPTDRRGFQSIIFDCDSTLSTIEGIDELARSRGRYDEIKALTDAAMAGAIPLENVYDRRLEMLQPTRSDIAEIADRYREAAVADAREVIAALHATGKRVFIVSGGLLDAVRPFGLWLGVPEGHIRAVPIRYRSASGIPATESHAHRPDDRYLNTMASPLTRTDGKSTVVRELIRSVSGRSMLVGDGVSDLVAARQVDLFVGYIGVAERPRVAADAEVLVTSESLAPLLGLALTAADESRLDSTSYRDLVIKSRDLIRSGALTIQKDLPS
jgi:phosphoserine phosphatase